MAGLLRPRDALPDRHRSHAAEKPDKFSSLHLSLPRTRRALSSF
jgi:hypothetical protein